LDSEETRRRREGGGREETTAKERGGGGARVVQAVAGGIQGRVRVQGLEGEGGRTGGGLAVRWGGRGGRAGPKGAKLANMEEAEEGAGWRGRKMPRKMRRDPAGGRKTKEARVER
jgi:hypothetical protein